MHILPVFAFEQISEYEEESQVQQDIRTNALVLQFDRVGRVGQEGHEILDLLVELLFVQRAGLGHDGQLIARFMCQRRAGQRVKLLLAAFYHLNLLASYHLATLQADQNVRHTDVREHLVVHAPWTCRVFVEGFQVAVEPIGAANPRHQGQVGRRSAEPVLGVRRLHADVHVVANLGAGEHQFIEHHIMRDAQVIGHALVTLELGAVATHAIVGERASAILQGGLVRHIHVDFFQLGAMLGREGQEGADLRQQRALRSRRQYTQYTQDHERNAEHPQPDLAQPALVAHGLDRASVEPRQHEQHRDGPAHGDHAHELVGDRPQDRVERREVPDRGNVFRCLEGVGLFEVRFLQEITTHLREKEHDRAEHEQEHDDTDNVFHGVVRVERNAIQRDAVLVLVLLDVHTIGVVRTHFVQRQDVQHHQTENHDRQGHHVQGEEAVQGDARDQVVTTNPLGQVVADHRDRAEQRDDHLGAPVRHLAPRQQVAHEGLSHQRQVDQHAEHPHQLTRLLVRTVEQTTEHMQVDHDEERRGAGGVQQAQDRAVLDVTHDVFDGSKRLLRRRGVAHGQPDAGNDLIDQHQQCQGAEEVEEVEVFWCVILAEMVFPHFGGGEARIDPIHELTHHAFSLSRPMTMMSSDS